jgi:hypothetical protein
VTDDICASAKKTFEELVMADESVIAVYATLDKARHAINILSESGFPAAQVSLVARGRKDQSELLQKLALPDDSLYDAAVAAGLGSVVGVLTGVAAMVVSGIGLVFLVGPIGGGIVGGITGGFIGTMAGWGVHERLLKHYERLIESGNVLIMAIGNPLELVHAHQTLEATEATELHTYSQSDDDASSEAGAFARASLT